MALAPRPLAALLRVGAGGAVAVAVAFVGIPLTFVWWNYLGLFG
jgi:hypothetical protein